MGKLLSSDDLLMNVCEEYGNTKSTNLPLIRSIALSSGRLLGAATASKRTLKDGGASPPQTYYIPRQVGLDGETLLV